MARPKRKAITGRVISTKMQKTIIVQTQHLVRHPRYKRIIRRYSKFKVHDQDSTAKQNDVVRIMETRPISKDKRWRLVEVINKSS